LRHSVHSQQYVSIDWSVDTHTHTRAVYGTYMYSVFYASTCIYHNVCPAELKNK